METKKEKNSVLELNEKTFENFIKEAKVPVLVDFWAEWCGPCRMLSPILEQLAEEYGERVVFTKVNVDLSPLLSAQYRIQGIPAVKVFKNGDEVFSSVGAQPKEYWKKELDSLL